MINDGFTLLWAKILKSSIWMEDMPTRIVWITMLAMKNADGMVLASPIGLAHWARVSPGECKAALATFLAPDPESSNPANDGRRISEVKGGWQILNHEEYQFSTEAKREFWKSQKAEQRARKAALEPRPRKLGKNAGQPLSGERSHQMASDAGASQEQLNSIVDRAGGFH